MIDIHIMQRLALLAKQNGPLCVGLDTDPSYLPPAVIEAAGSREAAVLAYNKEIISLIAADKSACCCKVQIAYYEALGIQGLKAYAETLRAIKAAGLIAISDIKRGDIANTAAAYARAHFSGDFETDIITVNPYMGFDTLRPFTDYCTPSGGRKGMFVLLRTSNPGAADIQQQELKNGGIVLERVIDELNRQAAHFRSLYGKDCCSPVGAVVGCTQQDDATYLRERCPDVFFLIPGYGAQGGDAAIAAALLKKAGGTVNSSRAVLCAWQKDAALAAKRESGALRLNAIAASAAQAAIQMKNELVQAAAY